MFLEYERAHSVYEFAVSRFGPWMVECLSCNVVNTLTNQSIDSMLPSSKTPRAAKHTKVCASKWEYGANLVQPKSMTLEQGYDTTHCFCYYLFQETEGFVSSDFHATCWLTGWHGWMAVVVWGVQGGCVSASTLFCAGTTWGPYNRWTLTTSTIYMLKFIDHGVVVWLVGRNIYIYIYSNIYIYRHI